MSQSPIVGIDLGTTYSLLSIMQNGVPILIPNALGHYLTPSAVSVSEDGSMLVGEPARLRGSTHPDKTAQSFKRDMGTERTVMLGGIEMTATQLSALVLSSLKADAEALLGMPIEEAVVTVPAYFADAQRQATRDAGKLAGLRVERIINEPTAAALAYGLHERKREICAVVLDLGGGTFDVTALEIIEGVIEIQSTAGDAKLGGDDFDAVMAKLVRQTAREQFGLDLAADPVTWARTRQACEQAKRRLSDSPTTAFVLAQARHGDSLVDVELRLERSEIETAWEPLLARLRTPILRALRDAGWGVEQVDEILLVGGSTRMPCVSKLSATVLGRLPLRALPPDHAVAMGAAVQAALKADDAQVEDIVVTDVLSHTLGISTAIDMSGTEVVGIFSPIIERGTVIPVSRVQTFHTMHPRQRLIEVEVYQGEHSLCSDNVFLGKYLAKGIPATAEAQDVDIRFTYDLNGILEVETTINVTQKKQVLVLEQTAGRMTAAQLKNALKEMERLKVHPREMLPNQTVLARADALFVELTGSARREMGTMIAVFRTALDSQDREPIDEAREVLLEFISALSDQG